MSTLAVVEEILRETQVPMSVRQIVELAGERLPTKSKTPDTVVARDLSMDIKKKGETSTFIRTAPGRYTIREIHLNRLIQQTAETASAVPAESRPLVQEPPPNPVPASAPPTPVLATAMRADRAPALAAKVQAAPEEHAGTGPR